MYHHTVFGPGTRASMTFTHDTSKISSFSPHATNTGICNDGNES
jgi:hypothetical protein